MSARKTTADLCARLEADGWTRQEAHRTVAFHKGQDSFVMWTRRDGALTKFVPGVHGRRGWHGGAVYSVAKAWELLDAIGVAS